MKRDMDLIRNLMIDICDGNLDWDAMDEKEMYHLEMLVQKNYVTGVQVNPGYFRKLGPVRLTFDGHEFAETIRPKSVWNKIKSVAKDKGVGLTLESISKIGAGVVASVLTA